MANKVHLDRLKAAIDAGDITLWNRWRKENLDIRPELSEADLSGANLSRANLSEANLYRANLSEANLWRAILAGAYLSEADLMGACLSEANLWRADLTGAYLWKADLTEADLTEAILTGATLLETNLENATLIGCRIYGISAWGLELKGAKQSDLIISSWNEPNITVDNLEVAQFIHLLLHSEKIRNVIDTITAKVVLILGRFTKGRKAVLEAVRDELRHRDLLPVIFDFDPPSNRDLMETVRTLAHMARYIIADITDPKSIPQELTAIIPNLPSVPVQPVILASQREYGMYDHWRRFPWVLPLFHYDDTSHLLASLTEKVIEPAETKRLEMLQQKRPAI